MTDRPNVLVTRPIMEAPLARLQERCDVTVHENEFGIPRDELLRVVAGRDAIVTMLTEKVDAEFLEAAGPQLRIVANHAVGFDNVDVDACTEAGVLATNTPDVLTETTADTAFALLMAAARRVGEGERFLRATTTTFEAMGQQQVITMTAWEWDTVDPKEIELPAEIKALVDKKPS